MGNAPTVAQSPSVSTNHLDGLRRLDWVIVGGESGPKARNCFVRWIRSIRDQCKAASVPCFVKQLGSHPIDYSGTLGKDVDLSRFRTFFKDRKGGDPSEWPPDLRVREYPEGARARTM